MQGSRVCKAVVITHFILAAVPAIAQADWTGVYAGLSFGAGQGNANISLSSNTFSDTVAEDIGATTEETFAAQRSGKLRGSSNGSLANLLVGYNFNPTAYSNFVFSGQLEGTFFSSIMLDTDGQRNSTLIQSFDDGVISATNIAQVADAYELSDELQSMFSLVFRAGYLVQPCTLIYGLIGPAGGNFVAPVNDDFIGQKQNKWVAGYVVGAGLEYKFNTNWSVRGEYRFINFNYSRNNSTNELTTLIVEGPNNDSITTSSDVGHLGNHFNFNMGLVSIIYQFA